jgi:hypothetical protein
MSRPTLIVAAMIGVVLGIGLFTFRYAEGVSYFSTDPKACANCHIMNDQYASWAKGPHHNRATCVECAQKAGVAADKLAPALALQRKAQWRLDFVAAENSMGFHAPAETAHPGRIDRLFPPGPAGRPASGNSSGRRRTLTG